MNNQKEIVRKQNDEGMLKCQYAARIYYNRAELISYISWGLALIGAVIVFIPDSFGVGLLIIPIIIDILSLVLQCSIEQNVKNGALMRNFFDAKVLGICNSYSSSEERNVWEKANTISSVKNNTFAYQSTHSGKDTPPGLKDWYVFSKTYTSPEEAVFECQKQNFLWTDKLKKTRIHIYIAVAAFFLVITVIGIHFSLLKTILCLLSFAVNLFYDFRGFIHCSHVMQSIKTIVELQSDAISPCIIEDLQKRIIERRKIQVLEINILHKKNASKWTTLYENMSADINSH